MENPIKVIVGFLVGAVIIGLFGSVVFAQGLSEADKTARAKYFSAREQYLKEADFYKNSRQQFLDAKENYGKLKNAENKAAYEEEARNFLTKTIDALIKKLEAMKNWVSTRQALSEAERQSIIAEIDEDIAWLQGKKSGIDTATSAEVKEKAKEIRDYWSEHRVKVKRIIAQVWVARLSYAIERFENASAKISEKIAELKAAGKDTTQLEAWLDDFNQKISLAKEKRDKAKERYQAISNLAEANQLFREVNQFIKDANQYLREAHQRLVEIVNEMRKISGGEEAPANFDATP